MSGDVDNASLPPQALRGLTDEQTERLTGVLDTYLAALEAGEPLDLNNLLAEHADLREPLKLYLDKLGELHDFAAGFSPHLAEEPLQNDDTAKDLSVQSLQATNSHPNSSDRQQDPGSPTPTVPHNPLLTSLLSGELDPQSQTPQARRLGDYELTRIIGRGGMGIVYEATQLSLKRRVALKLLPLISVLDARQITRFKNEAQAAASLQHANIVPVYSVGSFQGVHYYAMRLIEGKPLDTIIDQLRTGTEPPPAAAQSNSSKPKLREAAASLSALSNEVQLTPDQWRVPSDYRAVVTLGIQAAKALAHAHCEGIVHRDIKPSNLIVDAHGKVWITDFGLARRVNDHTLTATGDIMGTLRYMSPEQSRGETALIDGRSDIYSLGATLYELLALEPAIVGDSSPALIRAIESQSPISLRQHRPDVPRDLVTVLETAMAKSREDRYVTSQDFADDLHRVLQGMPTLAKPPSLFVRMAKWTLRNQRQAKIAALVMMALCLTLGAGLWMVVRSGMQSEADRKKLQQSLQECYSQTVTELAGVHGAEHVRQQLLNRLLAHYRSFVNDSRRNRAARSDLAMGLMHLGELYSDLGDLGLAEQALREAKSLFHSLVIASAGSIETRRKLAESSDQLGRVLQLKGDAEAAEQAAREAIEGLTALTAAYPTSPVFLVDRARATNHLALMLSDAGNVIEAERLLTDTRTLLEKYMETSSEPGEVSYALSATFNNLARIAGETDPKTAVAYYQRSIDLKLEIAKSNASQSPSAELAVAYSNLGKAQSHAGEPQQAAKAYQEAISIQRLLVRIAPANFDYVRELAISHNNLGRTEFEMRQIKSAEEHFREAIRLDEQLLTMRPSDSGLMHELGGCYNNLAMLLRGQTDSPTVEATFESALRIQSSAVKLAPAVREYRQFLDQQLMNYAKWLQGLGRDDRAIQLVRQRQSLWPEDGEKLMQIAKELAEVALERAAKPSQNKSGNAYVTVARDAISLAEQAGVSVQSSLTQEPFASLARIKPPTD